MGETRTIDSIIYDRLEQHVTGEGITPAPDGDEWAEIVSLWDEWAEIARKGAEAQ